MTKPDDPSAQYALNDGRPVLGAAEDAFAPLLRVPSTYARVPKDVRDALLFVLREQVEMFMGLLGEAAERGLWASNSHASEGARPSRLRGHHVLVVDDEASHARMLMRRLGGAGFEANAIHCASSGHEALLLAGARPPALIFIDREMPGMTGIELTYELRQRLPATPLIGCTSEAGRSVRAEFLAAGADDCLAKPVSQPLLDAVVLRWLSGLTAE